MKKVTLFVSALLFSSLTFADVAVIVHPSNANVLDGGEVNRIFIGKAKSFPDGSQAVPISQVESSAATGEFNQKVLKKSASQLKAYWSKLIFTGKGAPPKEVATDAEVIALVSTNPNLIGYVDAGSADGSVKVVATF